MFNFNKKNMQEDLLKLSVDSPLPRNRERLNYDESGEGGKRGGEVGIVWR